MAKNGIKGKIYSLKWDSTAEKGDSTTGFLMYIFPFKFQKREDVGKLREKMWANFGKREKMWANLERRCGQTFCPF